MAIGAILKGAKKARDLIKKKGKRAINVTTEKASPLVQKAKEKAGPAVKKAKETIKKVTPESVKKAGATIKSKSAAAAATAKKATGPAVDKVKQTARATSVKVRRAMGPEGRATARRLRDAAAVGVGGTVGGTIGTLVAPTITGASVGAATGAIGAKEGNKMRAAGIGGTIGGLAGAAITAGLASSVIKSSSPKESKYATQKMANGRYSTAFEDSGKNRVTSKKMLSEKDTQDIKTALAVLDAIVTSDNPQGQRALFIQTVMQLNNKYGINMIEGKNLSIQLPTAGEVLVPSNEGLIGFRQKQRS